MKTLDRYISSIFLKNLLQVLLALIILYGLIEFLEKVDNFIENQAAAVYYLLYPLYNLPLMISNTLPMAILLSAFITIGGLSRSNQLTALLGSGLSIGQISRSMFVIGILASISLLFCNMWLTPLGIQETEYIKNYKISGKEQTDTSVSTDLYFRSGNQIVHINRSFPQREVLLGVTVIRISDSFIPLERLQAKSARYDGDGRWVLEQVKKWHFSLTDKSFQNYEEHKKWPFQFGKKPSEMSQLWNNPEEMTQNELDKIIVGLKQDGHDPARYQIEWHQRFAKSLIPLIMVLLGIPFALRKGRQVSFSIGVIISLVIFVVYFILQAVFVALGASTILPPIIAAWSANALAFLTGSWMFLKAQS